MALVGVFANNFSPSGTYMWYTQLVLGDFMFVGIRPQRHDCERRNDMAADVEHLVSRHECGVPGQLDHWHRAVSLTSSSFRVQCFVVVIDGFDCHCFTRCRRRRYQPVLA